MNVNENIFVKPRGRGRGRYGGNKNLTTIQRVLATKNKTESKTASTLFTNDSNLVWRKKQSSNESTCLQTVSSSRSYSVEPDARIILALTEGRGQASYEMGIAAIDISRPSITLCQFADSQSYINTLTKINVLNPTEILVPNSFSFTSNRLMEKVKDHFKNTNITAVPRNNFNKSNGIQALQNVCLSELKSIMMILQHRYYALTAASALLNYVENVLNIVYSHNSLKVEYQESEGFTIIDISTADNLELVSSACRSNKSKISSLFGILNHCLTRIGSRTLRSSILQPSCSIPDIEAKLDCVQELMETPNKLTAVQGILMKLANIEQILSLSSVLARTNAHDSESQLNYVLLLNTSLELLIPLYDILQGSRQPSFIELRDILSCPDFNYIRNVLRKVIHDDAHPAKGAHGISQRCFAVKSGVNGMLDMARKLYSERLEEMREYIKKIAEKFNMFLTLQNNNKKGHHIQFTLNVQQRRMIKKSDLPSEFIYVERLSNSFTFKTEELIDMSTRVDDLFSEILKISNKIIRETLLGIQQYMPLFYKLCENIAKLDMLQSLAEASHSASYVRPIFGDFMELKHSRHPLLEYLCSQPPVANDVFASDDYNMTIITGPNASGKSIYIRQILLLQVMAQLGCYVPAESAVFRVSDRILARVYLEDYLDCGASAFVLELKEIQCFLRMMTKNTLLIVDELCRSTSVDEGTSMAMAIAEKLSRSSGFIFFTTHYKFLAKLQDMYYNIKTLQLDAVETDGPKGIQLKYNYNVIPGVCNLEKYGIYLAKMALSETVIQYSEQYLTELSKIKKLTTEVEKVDASKRLKYNFESSLRILKMKRLLSRRTINDKLLQYQVDLANRGCIVNISAISETSNYLPNENCEDNATGPTISNGFPRHFLDLSIDPIEIHQDIQHYVTENRSANDENIQLSPESDYNNFYINPHVIYSPSSMNDVTIEMGESSNDVSFVLRKKLNETKNVCDEDLLNYSHVEYKSGRGKRICNEYMIQSNYELMLEKDIDTFSQFSKSFDEHYSASAVENPRSNNIAVQDGSKHVYGRSSLHYQHNDYDNNVNAINYDILENQYRTQIRDINNISSIASMIPFSNDNLKAAKLNFPNRQQVSNLENSAQSIQWETKEIWSTTKASNNARSGYSENSSQNDFHDLLNKSNQEDVMHQIDHSVNDSYFKPNQIYVSQSEIPFSTENPRLPIEGHVTECQSVANIIVTDNAPKKPLETNSHKILNENQFRKPLLDNIIITSTPINCTAITTFKCDNKKKDNINSKTSSDSLEWKEKNQLVSNSERFNDSDISAVLVNLQSSSEFVCNSSDSNSKDDINSQICSTNQGNICGPNKIMNNNKQSEGRKKEFPIENNFLSLRKVRDETGDGDERTITLGSHKLQILPINTENNITNTEEHSEKKENQENIVLTKERYPHAMKNIENKTQTGDLNIPRISYSSQNSSSQSSSINYSPEISLTSIENDLEKYSYMPEKNTTFEHEKVIEMENIHYESELVSVVDNKMCKPEEIDNKMNYTLSSFYKTGNDFKGAIGSEKSISGISEVNSKITEVPKQSSMILQYDSNSSQNLCETDRTHSASSTISKSDSKETNINNSNLHTSSQKRNNTLNGECIMEGDGRMPTNSDHVPFIIPYENLNSCVASLSENSKTLSDAKSTYGAKPESSSKADLAKDKQLQNQIQIIAQEETSLGICTNYLKKCHISHSLHNVECSQNEAGQIFPSEQLLLNTEICDNQLTMPKSTSRSKLQNINASEINETCLDSTGVAENLMLMNQSSISKASCKRNINTPHITVDTSKADTTDKSTSSKSRNNFATDENTKKPKFKTPVKAFNPKKNIFYPPKILSKKQIQNEFSKQSNKLMESWKTTGDMTKYLEHIQNRPSAQQLVQSKTVAVIHNTDDGVVILPAPENKVRKRKFETPLKHSVLSKDLDMSIFSDKNSENFEKYLQDTKRQVPIYELCNPSLQVLKAYEQESENSLHSKVRCIDSENFCLDIKENIPEGNPLRDHPFLSDMVNSQNSLSFTCSFATKNPSSSRALIGQNTSTNISSTRDGYYKQNKIAIDNIVGKYISNGSQSSQQSSININNCNNSIFSNTTINLKDLM